VTRKKIGFCTFAAVDIQAFFHRRSGFQTIFDICANANRVRLRFLAMSPRHAPIWRPACVQQLPLPCHLSAGSERFAEDARWPATLFPESSCLVMALPSVVCGEAIFFQAFALEAASLF
jgi:hypothetical protein